MNLGAIAEGIETREQLDFLLKKGCALGQGYFFRRPMPAEEFSTFLKNSARTNHGKPG